MTDWLKFILVLLFFLLWSFDRAFGVEVDRVDRVDKVSQMVETLLDGTKRRLATDEDKRREFASLVVAAADEYDTPEGLLTAMSYRESSFRPTAVGWKRGEVGLLQIHGRALTTCPHKDEIDEPANQLLCGSRWLKVAFDTCGETWEGALTAYASGKCKPPNVRTRRVVADRLALWKRLEGSVE